MWEIIGFTIAIGYGIVLPFIGFALCVIEDHAPAGKEGLWLTLYLLWPITVILLSPILIVLVVKYIAVGPNSALGWLYRGIKEIGSIYKGVISR